MDPVARQVFENPVPRTRIRAFQAWEQRNAARMLARYAELPVTNLFGLRPTDVVTPNPRTRFELGGAEPKLFDASGQCVGTFANTPVDWVRRLLAALDGQRSVAALCAEPPFAERPGFVQALIEPLLGEAFLIPATLDELERQLPAVELLRFPSQSPYAMPREYWENSIAVRRALGVFYEGVHDFAAFSAGLCGLHRLATLGASAANFYGGAGGTPTVPGRLRDGPVENHYNDGKKWIFAFWLRLLEAPYALLENGEIVSSRQVPFGRVTDDGHTCRHAYGEAGEQLASALNEVRVHLAAACAALTGDRASLLRHCALFHHAFAHAHPFGNINNSIAMNVVNDLLRRAGIGVVPHLYFDQVAYFLQPEDYVDLFERAVKAHAISEQLERDRPATRALLQGVQRAVAGDYGPRG
jgi:hypothetical protein